MVGAQLIHSVQVQVQVALYILVTIENHTFRKRFQLKLEGEYPEVKNTC